MSTPHHLLRVGFPKARATFFKAWCQSREDVAFVQGGGAGFSRVIDVTDVPKLAPGLRATSCEELSVCAGERRGFKRGRTSRVDTPSYYEFQSCVAPCQADTLRRDHRALFPTAHILILFRGYDSMCRSVVSQSVRGRSWWAAQTEKFLEGTAATLGYDRVVPLYEGAFGPDRVTVLPYKLLWDDTSAVLAALCPADGIPYRSFDPGRVAASPSPHALRLAAWVSAAVHGGAGMRPARWLARVLDRYATVMRRAR